MHPQTCFISLPCYSLHNPFLRKEFLLRNRTITCSFSPWKNTSSLFNSYPFFKISDICVCIYNDSLMNLFLSALSHSFSPSTVLLFGAREFYVGGQEVLCTLRCFIEFLAQEIIGSFSTPQIVKTKTISRFCYMFPEG